MKRPSARGLLDADFIHRSRTMDLQLIQAKMAEHLALSGQTTFPDVSLLYCLSFSQLSFSGTVGASGCVTIEFPVL
jgi:hypothetical protein